jgi:2-oxoglutarate ferredoxin oxidoreductase subunit beta
MNNGCYGLTKGQDSATADVGSKSKAGSVNMFEGIDLCGLAIELGATFVAQSFSGDKTQLVPLIQAAMSHPGFALINVLSPCVTFNNNVGSTKSYDYVREHVEATGTVDYVPPMEEITTSYEDDETKMVKMHDGSWLRLHKLSQAWNPDDKLSVINALQKSYINNEILTGLLYINTETKDLHTLLNTTDIPLNQLDERVLCPGNESLEEINSDFR